MDHFIIAAGGTGAMCTQAFVHLAAAGCAQGDATYHVLLIDKDNDSDAKTDCANLLESYDAMRSQLGNLEKSQLRLPKIMLYNWNFSDQILDEYRRKTGKNPDALGAMTLKNLMNPDSDAITDRLLRTLYTEDELNLDLDKGFYGHPNIGSAVFSYIEPRLSAPIYKDAAGKTVTNAFISKLNSCLNNGKTHVYLFASLFGGTGATVIPNMVRMLRALDSAGNLILGSAVMMPYFRLPSPREDSVERLSPIHPSDAYFAEQAREALRYYHRSGLCSNLMNMTLIGNSSPDVTSEIYASGGKQTQHYHMVLQVAATVANRFFADQLGEMKSSLAAGTLTAGEVLFWKIAPQDPNFHTLTPTELGLSDEFEKMDHFLRFAVVISNYLRAVFSRPLNQLKDERLVEITIDAEWPKGKGSVPDSVIQSKYVEPIQTVSAFSRRFIEYYYDIALSGFDWSQYREQVPDPTATPVEKNGVTYYRYITGGIKEDFFQSAQDRWVDVININRMKFLQEAEDPHEAVNRLSLNELFSYDPLDEGHAPVEITRFKGNIGDIYVNKVQPSYKRFLSWDRTSLSEVFDRIYMECE